LLRMIFMAYFECCRPSWSDDCTDPSPCDCELFDESDEDCSNCVWFRWVDD